jgi:phospholipase/carboxylesterase
LNSVLTDSKFMHGSRIVEEGKPLLQAEKAIILLHGRGADADDIISLAEMFCDDSFYIVAPEAEGNTWYPFSFLMPENQNEPWLSSAVQTVKQILDKISRHIAGENIFMMGFSQGACLSLEVAARYPSRYGGVAAFSGGLIGETVNAEKYHGDFAGTKIFLGNSDIDPHIPLDRTLESGELLKKLGADVTVKIYPTMPHTIIQDEIDEVRRLMF